MAKNSAFEEMPADDECLRVGNRSGQLRHVFHHRKLGARDEAQLRSDLLPRNAGPQDNLHLSPPA